MITDKLPLKNQGVIANTEGHMITSTTSSVSVKQRAALTSDPEEDSLSSQQGEAEKQTSKTM